MIILKMISYFKNLKFNKLKAKSYKLNKGMTYVELIVVLAIFAIMSSIVLFNYGEFQAKVSIKNLASEIALKIVEAQKSALSGKWNSGATSGWKPSYGVYFNSSATNDVVDDIPFNKKFIYFADFDNIINGYNGNPSCSTTECLDKILITKNNYIEKIEGYFTSVSASTPITEPLSIIFKRPNSSAVFYSNGILNGFDYIQITIKSPKEAKAYIKIYPSGRIQVD